MAEKTYTRVKSTRLACLILTTLAESKEPITGAEVAIRIETPAGTVMSQLATLEDEGFAQEVGGGWRIGMKLALMWARVKANKEIERDRINSEIEQLGEG